MTRRRLRPRIETDLIQFSVDAIVKNKEGTRHTFGQHTLIDEAVNGRYQLVVYTNGKRTEISFPICEMPIKGRLSHVDPKKGVIEHQIPIDKRIRFYITHNGKRRSYLYFNPKTGEWGTVDSLAALWTSQSISQKAQEAWRAAALARKGRCYKQKPRR